jgi:succinyl-diaminopimelate desuccinylase
VHLQHICSKNFRWGCTLPIGLDAPQILAEVDKIVPSYPEVTYRMINYNPPSWCPSDAEMAGARQCQGNRRHRPDPDYQSRRHRRPAVALQGYPGDRLWPVAERQGSVEQVTVDEFFHVVKCHVLSAYDYMSRPG